MTGGDEQGDAHLSRGSATFGKYRLFAKVGSGGMAEVFLAVSHGPAGFTKLVVLKRLRSHIADDAPMVAMFLDEARLAARLTHPNIVHTYEVGEHDGAYFIAMEYLEGQPLNRLLRAPAAREMIAPVMWAHVVSEALGGLHYAHQLADYNGEPLRIVHRDISPHNIFLTYGGEAKLVDFGIAKAAVNSQQTASGILKGKVSYMSPEQIRGEADPRSDLFAMGVTLWELLVGRKLFAGDSPKVLNAILNEPIPRVLSQRPDIDPELDDIVARALEKSVDSRYQTAEDMREALAKYIRTTGQVVREETIGAAVTTMFQATKVKVHLQVQQQMQGIAQAAGSASQLVTLSGPYPAVAIDRTSTIRSTTVVDSQLGMIGSDNPSPNTSVVPEPARDDNRGRRDKAIAILGGAALLAISLLVGTQMLTRKKPVVVDATGATGKAVERTVQLVTSSTPNDAPMAVPLDTTRDNPSALVAAENPLPTPPPTRKVGADSPPRPAHVPTHVRERSPTLASPRPPPAAPTASTPILAAGPAVKIRIVDEEKPSTRISVVPD